MTFLNVSGIASYKKKVVIFYIAQTYDSVTKATGRGLLEFDSRQGKDFSLRHYHRLYCLSDNAMTERMSPLPSGAEAKNTSSLAYVFTARFLGTVTILPLNRIQFETCQWLRCSL
jgi:hypothetical protein